MIKENNCRILVLLLTAILIFSYFSCSLINMESYNPVDQLDLFRSSETAILRPNGDFLTEWDGTSTPHWSRIDEVTPDYSYVTWIAGDNLQSEIFDMETVDIGSQRVQKVEVHILGFRYWTGWPNVTINLGGWINNGDTIFLTLNKPDAWDVVTFDNLDGSNNDLANLQVKITVSDWVSGPPRNGYGEINTIYCVVTYNGDTSGSEGGSDDGIEGGNGNVSSFYVETAVVITVILIILGIISIGFIASKKDFSQKIDKSEDNTTEIREQVITPRLEGEFDKEEHLPREVAIQAPASEDIIITEELDHTRVGTLHCSFCGKLLSEDEIFCEQCGTKK